MALSIDYTTKVISVPRNDMALIQSLPVEVRELNLNTFRLNLKDWEDGEQGMFMPTTHNHVAPISVGGVTLARVVEMINDYTITFEDGQYAVNLTGANSNIGDRVNVNQVSVRSSNSAGLLQTREIEYASFDGGVWLDMAAGSSGTAYPRGTRQSPVNNLTDAMLVASVRGFSRIYVLGNATLNSGGNYVGMTFEGESQDRSVITVASDANVMNCEFYNATITGTLDGDSLIEHALIENLAYVSGFVENTVLADGTITLGGAMAAHFLSCFSGSFTGNAPTIDCGGDGPPLILRNYSGAVRLINKSGLAQCAIDLSSGSLVLDSTVTAGTIVVRGVGTLVNNSTGTAVVDSSGLIQAGVSAADKAAIADMILDMADSVEPGLTVRGSLRLALAALAGKVSGAAGTEVTFRNALADTKPRITATVDEDGNRTAITLDPST